MTTDIGATFRAMHEVDGVFLIPNPWDVGAARMLASLGFKALATTSSGFAAAIGKGDGATTRDEALANCRAIAAATPLPVNGDLEKGYGDRPEDAAETVRLAAEAGLAGCSIEDYSGTAIYDIGLAKERIAAAVEVDDVQILYIKGGKAPAHRQWVIAVLRGSIEVTFQQAYALAVFEIDSRDKSHSVSPTKFCSRRAPA